MFGDKTTLKKQVADACIVSGDDVNEIVFVLQLRGKKEKRVVEFKDLPERVYDSGYGGTEKDLIVGFSPNWIYVCVCYDGAEWIEAVPRTLVAAYTLKGDLPELGGG